MVKINDREFKTYDLDTLKTIYERIAADMKTLPKFLIFKNGLPDIALFSTNKNIEVDNLLDSIKNIENIYELYKKVKTIEENMLENITLQNCVYYYIILNKNFNYQYKIATEYSDIIKIQTIKDIVSNIDKVIKEYNIQNYYNVQQNIEDMWLRKIKNTQILNDNIKKNINKWDPTYTKKNEISIFKIFDDTIGVIYTDFKLEKVKFEFTLEIENISSILELFNIIELNNNIPFASTNNFYKILNEFIPPPEWANLFDKSTSFRDKYKDIDRKNNILLKVLEEKKVKNIDSYTEVILSIKELNVIQVNIEYNTENISKKEVITRILSIFKTDRDSVIKNEKENNVNGIFFIPSQSLNKEGLLDMILNNNLFSNLLSVNETKIGQRQSLHVYFENSKIGNITAKLSSGKDEINNYLMNKDKNVRLDSSYVRIKITKCESIEKVKYFQQLFSKLITIYNQDIDSIVEIYNTYKCPIKEEDVEIIKKTKEIKLRDIDPFVFKANYGKFCDIKPKYISDEDAEIKISEGIEVMKFPKEVTETSYPKYYICDDALSKYPGLRNNPFENNEILPYIPCCYETNQKNIKGSKYRNYYFDEPLNEKEYKGQDIKKSNKILEQGVHGYLPENLNKLFYIGDQDGIYFREGIYRSKSSFLNCVLQSLSDKNILNNKDESRLKKYLNNKRKELAKFAVYCKQELYDYTIDQIKKKIEDTEEYFDPKLFVHLLEIYFECNIFIFSRENNGKIIIPRNLECYYKMKNKDRCIFVFEHMGSRSDKALYPQCELIIRQVSEYKKETESVFPYNSEISKNIFDVFINYSLSYDLNKKIFLIDINWPWTNAVSQYIDSYGKTRIINIKYNNELISIITTPIQPLNLEDENNIIHKTSTNIAYKILKKLNATNIVENTKEQKIIGKIGNVICDILVDDKVVNLKETFSKTVITEYNNYKKIARYVVEYLFWLFSKYLKDKGILIDNITEEVYKNFKNKFIEIDPLFKYENVGKLFSMKNSGIIKNNKLIVKSEETLKRLFYILRLEITRNHKELFDYYQRSMIKNYYLDITDFNYKNNQIILQGESAFYRLIIEDNKNIIHKEVYFKKDKIKIDKKLKKEDDDEDDEDDEEDEEDQEEEKEDDKNNLQLDNKNTLYETPPYFFKNKNIDNKIYLAQNVDNILKAIKIAETWHSCKYNTGTIINVKNVNIKKFKLYSFVNVNNIKLYNVEGEENNLDIKILGYKIKDTKTYQLIPFYTVLLKL
jgi:hypothetical protein